MRPSSRGDLVGEMALLHAGGRGRRNATVIVSTNATVYAGSRAEFARFWQPHLLSHTRCGKRPRRARLVAQPEAE